jgi:hypothetical protein
MPIGSPKRRLTDLESVQDSNEVYPNPVAANPLDTASLAALRSLFELLDQWDQKENSDDK